MGLQASLTASISSVEPRRVEANKVAASEIQLHHSFGVRVCDSLSEPVPSQQEAEVLLGAVVDPACVA